MLEVCGAPAKLEYAAEMSTHPVRIALAILSLSLAAFIGCGGGAEIGEGCDAEGDAAQCVDGAICGKNNSEVLECLKTCVNQTDCTPDQDCNGVSGTSVKGCRPKDTEK